MPPVSVDHTEAKVGELITWTLDTSYIIEDAVYRYDVYRDNVLTFAKTDYDSTIFEYVPMQTGLYSLQATIKTGDAVYDLASTTKVHITPRDATPGSSFEYRVIAGNYIEITKYIGTDISVAIPEEY